MEGESVPGKMSMGQKLRVVLWGEKADTKAERRVSRLEVERVAWTEAYLFPCSWCRSWTLSSW